MILCKKIWSFYSETIQKKVGFGMAMRYRD